LYEWHIITHACMIWDISAMEASVLLREMDEKKLSADFVAGLDRVCLIYAYYPHIPILPSATKFVHMMW
jgi:hypothetical protein